MILKRFMRPKWQHPNPETRLQALGALADSQQDVLLEIARTDPDPAIRRSACKRIRDLAALAQVMATESDAGVREVAAARERALLCGQDGTAASLQQRLDYLSSQNNPATLRHLALHANEADLRKAALERVEDAATLAACAIADGSASNRVLAVSRLHDRQQLERVAREARKKDKNVYRLARARLKELSEREEAPRRLQAQCTELCERAERLGKLGTWSQDRILLDYLDRQRELLEASPDPALRERYDRARSGFLAAYEQYRQENRAQLEAEEAVQAVLQGKRALLKELAEALSARHSEEELRQLGRHVQERWQQPDPVAVPEKSELEKEYAELRRKVEEHLAHLRERRQQDEKAQELLAELESALAQSAPLESKAVAQRLRAAENLLSRSPKSEAADHLGDTKEQVQERLHKQKHHAEQKLRQLTEKMTELEVQIEEGELRKAEALHQSLSADVDLLERSGVPKAQFADVRRHLQQLLPRFKELKQWRRWSADQHREDLCRQVEEMVAADLPLEDLAASLHRAQMAWKRLDHGGSPANRSLWDRFHHAADHVYERCRPFLDERAEAREENRRRREALCAEIEEFVSKIDWDNIDWKKAVRAERDTRAAWAAIGPVEGKHRKALQERYRSALKDLDKHLADERARNLALRRDLITRVEALVEEPDLERAIEEIKRLQRQWHPTVPARQKQENALWRQFRAACDQVFERRRAAQEEQGRELKEHLARRLAISRDLETLARGPGSVEDLLHGYRELKNRWRESEGLPVPQREHARLKAAWLGATQELEQRLQQLRSEQQQEQLSRLQRRAALCRELEMRLAGTGEQAREITEIEQAWQAEPPLDDADAQRAIEQRFGQALEALTNAEDEAARGRLLTAWEDNRKRREEMCLHLEILSGVDSPPEWEKQRLAFQVSRLAGHMADGESDPLETDPQLEREWYLCGPAPAGAAAALEERFERARQALASQGRR